MGTPEFAVSSLEALIKNKFDVVGVITAPDKPAGRGQQMHQSAVKKYAIENDLILLQPERLKDPEFIEQLRALKADLQIVVAFRMLPEAVWNMPLFGTFNLHASLLPKYRGAAPINWAVINGETETGVTTFKLKHEIDTGNILDQAKVSIGISTTAGELHDTLMVTGAELVINSTRRIERAFRKNKPLGFQPQEEAKACHAPKIFKETCRINWNSRAEEIYNLVRGLSPHPGAFTEIQSTAGLQVMKIYGSKYTNIDHEQANGSVLTDGKTFLKVHCQSGLLEISDLQLQGKKRMPVGDFLRGFKTGPETRFA